MRLIPEKKSLQENSVYRGLQGEIVSIPSVGVAIHDGFKLGGALLTEQSDNGSGGRDNFVRNSNFFSIQNGDAFMGNTADKTYVMDGWWIMHNGGSSSNVARRNTFDSATNSSTGLVVTLFSGDLDSSYSILTQTYAYPSRFANKTLSLSYDIEANIDTSITNEFRFTFADVGTGNRGVLVGRESLNAGVNKRVSFTFNAPSIFVGDIINNNLDDARLLFWLDAGDDWNDRTGGILPFSGTFKITNVKLEESDKATEYQFNDYNYETAKVCEYFEKSGRTRFFSSIATSIHTNSCTLNVPFKHPKWTDLADNTYTASFLSGDSLNGRDTAGFTLTAFAASETSAARISGYTSNAEIEP